jgi:DNA polymerase-3 subunit delta'
VPPEPAPVTFAGIRGQDRAVAIIRRALESGRLPAAYLFTGPAGSGRRKTALAVAASLNCEAGPVACGECRSCRSAAAGAHPDVHLIARRAGKKEIIIEQVREEILGKAYLSPFSGRCSVFVVDGAEDMNQHAANAFLKTLEEPPAVSRFILVAPGRETLLPTVASRCQEVAFRPLGPALMEEILRAQGAPAARAALVARLSRGSLERAGRYLEEGSVERVGEEIDALLALGRQHPAAALDLAERWGRNREEALDRLDLLAQWVRDMLLLAAGGPAELAFHQAHLDRLRAGAAAWRETELAWALEAVENAREDIEQNANVELTMDRLFLTLRRAGS